MRIQRTVCVLFTTAWLASTCLLAASYVRAIRFDYESDARWSVFAERGRLDLLEEKVSMGASEALVRQVPFAALSANVNFAHFVSTHTLNPTSKTFPPFVDSRRTSLKVSDLRGSPDSVVQIVGISRGASLWHVEVAATAPMAYVLWRLYARRRKPLPGYCVACGYDLRASGDRCPECGTARADAR